MPEILRHIIVSTFKRLREKSVIEDLPVVSSVRFHAGNKTHKSGVYVNLRCDCGAKQVGPILKVERTSHEC